MDNREDHPLLEEQHAQEVATLTAGVSFPEVLTEAEAVRYLRLDLIATENPAGTLAYYRRKGLLRGTQIGKCVRYRRIELERFLERLTEANPR